MSILRSLRTRVVVGVAVVLAVVFGYSGWVIANASDDTTPPSVAKTLEDNGDGTYTLSLSVTGRADSSSSSSKADVIVVLDRSGSMNFDQAGHQQGSWQYSGPSRLSVAKNAVNDLAEQLLANNTADDPDRVQLSLVTFSNTASNDITGTTSLTQFQNRVNSITANGGTNWEDGLHDANAIATREGANVYVIFVSDGNPTFRNTKGGTGNWGDYAQHGTAPDIYYGTGSSDPNNNNFNYAVVQAQNIVNGGKTFYSVGAFGDASNMQNLATQSGAPASNYYDATDQTALNAAFANIINEITNALGYKSVKIEDGLTSMTSALVRTDPDSFTYTRSGGSYGDGQEWAGAPTASYADGKVTWDLGDMLLENGVTYTVSFKVWPSQEAYDLVSDLNNGLKTYDSLTAEQKAQIVGLDGGGYGLKTNTDVEFAYTQIETRTTNQRPEGFVEGQPAADGYTYTYDSNTGIYTGTKETTGTCTVDNPDPMPLTHSKLRVTKTWEDSLDPNQRPDEVTLHIKSDDNTYVEVTLNEDNNWTQEIDVAPGLIAEGETLETGHDYTIEEVDPDFHFELDADPFHPMIIDGVLGADDESGSGALVTATNVLKSRLNITKTVEHSADTTPNPDQLFTYKVKVTDIKGGDVWFSIGNSSGPIDVSGENRVTGATVDGDDPTYYHAASGAEFTVKIKGGENIFFNNLPTGSTYEVEEVDVPSAYTCTVTNSDSGATTSGNKTSGSITKANTQYNVAYKNAYKVSPATATIPVTKALSIPAGEIGPDDITGAYTFTLTADGKAPLPDTTTATNPDADGGTVSFGDITYTKPGTYTYHVSEAGSVDGVTNDPQASKTITVVVTDKGDGTLEVKVNGATPTADDAANTTFTNSYATTEVSAQIPVTKTLIVPSGLTGPGDITGAYTFTLAAADGAPMPTSGGETVSNPAATGGTASFGAITFTEPGEYTYTITESGSVDGVTNDATATKMVTVTVTDDAHGHLSATIKGADSTAAAPKSSTTFTNTYDATPTTANIPVKKVLNAASGLTPPDITDAYTFTLAAADGTPMPNVTELTNPDADGGTVTFGEISFNRIGTYTYTITESGNVDGVTNDSSGAKTVIVTVTDNGKGKLSASVSVSANNPVTFTNTYTVKPTTATVPVTKVLSVPDGLTGPSSIKEAYTFRLTPQNGAPAASASSVRNPDADGGTANFGAITFTEPGTYTYKITETGTVSGVTNDPAAASGKTVTIKVADNGDGTLTSTVVGADGTEEEPSENTTFTNTYAASGSVELEATKIAEGFKLEDGQFSFELRDADDNVRQTKQNDTDGNIRFDVIPYSAAGTYTYTISEVVVENDDIADDTHVAKVTVTVTDNGNGTLTATSKYEGATFTNTHTENEKDVVSAKDTTTSVDGELVEAGDTLTYTITYANNTSDTATVTVTDTIPTNTTYVDGSASDGGVFEGGTITWNIENVAAGATGTVTFQVTVNDDAGGETIENTANVSDGQNESSTNAVTTSVPVKNVYDYAHGDADGDAVEVGDILTYEVSFTLTEDATSVVVTDDVPVGTSYIADSASDGGTVSDGTITWDLGALKAGTYTVSFKAKVGVSALVMDTITNTASISVNNHSGVETNTVTNTPTDTAVRVEKIWENNGYEIPESVTVTLVATDADNNSVDLSEYGVTAAQELTESTGWEYAWENLPTKTIGTDDDEGSAITYAVEEDPVAGYSTKITGDAANGFVVTNTHADNTKTVSVGTSEATVDGELVGVGQVLTYTINYVNNTSGVATVTITDAIPSNTTYVDDSASDGGAYADGAITWTIENVAAGATGSVTFQVTVDDTAAGETIENTATVNDGKNDFDTNTVPVTVPKKDVQDDTGASIDGDGVKVGDELTYEISFELLTDATNVVVTDKVPDGTEFVSASNGGTESDGTVTWNLGELAVGEHTVTFKVKVTADAVTQDSINNTASIAVGDNDPAVTNETENNVDTSVTVEKVWDDGGYEERPESVEVTLKANGADATVDGATVTLNESNGWKHTWDGLDAADEDGTITYTVEEADVEGYSTTYSSKTDEDTQITTWTITNTHTENEKDVVSAKDTATSVDGELVEAGDILTYTITYANNTSDTATVTVTDTIPTNTTYVDGSASDGGVFEGGTITWNIENVAAGATGTVTFQVTVNDDAGGETIENTANVSDGQNESSTNAVTTSVPVKDVKDADDSSVDGGSIQVGDTLTYEVSFTLTEDATSVVVTDDVPANTTLVDGSISDSGSESGGTITWDLGALKAGTYTVSFKVTVDESAVTADAITNTASISVNNHSEVNTNTTTTTPEIGGLTISKTVEVPEGIEIDTDKVFSFTVSLADKNGNDLTGEYRYTGSSEGTITNGGTIQLKHGESVTIEGLPAGAKYSIAETAEAGYTPNQATIDGTISKGDEAARAEFVNTYAVKPVNVSFPVEKILNAASGLTPPDITEAFTFTLTAPDGTPMPDDTELTNPDADGGTVAFGDITYTTAGTYTYTVTESGTVAGVTNDTTSAKTVTVIVTDNGDGTLSATASSTEDAPLTFTNSYVVNPTTATITAQKVLEHADLAAGAFNFELSAADGTPMPTSPNATNAADGTVAFGEITYSTPGTYTYSIKETAGSAPYFDYDGSEKTVTVEVVDNSDGTLTATVTGDGEDATFTNTYKADSDEVFINAVKNVNGEAASQNIFEFTITADDGGTLPDETTVTNNGGSVTFGPIKYDAGIFDEAAPEPAPEPEPGRGEQDSDPAKVNVTLAPLSEVEGENVSVQLMADGEPSGDPVTLQKDAEGVFGPQTWSGLPKQNDEGNDVVYTATYSVDGGEEQTADDSMLSVENVETVAETSETEEPSKAAAARTKVFHYTITETAGSAPGYTYDGHSETVTVTVTDNGDGTLATKVAYDDDSAVFDNTYEASGEATIEATKVLTGAKLDAGQFEFGLFEGDTQVGEAVTNGADGAIAFTVPYVMDAEKSDVGTHTYIMRELVGIQQTGYTYDSSSKTVTVKVTDNGDGTLATEATYDGDMTFTNTYKPLPTEVVLEAEKILNGRDLADGEFSFQVTNKDGKVVSSGTNDASGMISFSAIPITEAGTYTFTAYEVKGDAEDVTYDETTYTYTVVVEDQDGQLTVTDVKHEGDQVTFTNTYTPPEPAPTPEPKPKPKSPVHKVAIPQTGDVMASPYPMVLLGIAVVAILAGILVRKRNSSFNKSSKRGDTSMRK